MLSHRWERIIDAISYIKPECIDSEKLKLVLDYDMEVDSQVLDNLYILGIINIDEYKYRMNRYIDLLESKIRYTKLQLKTAEENGTEYNPMLFYGLNSSYKGAAIQDKDNFDFMDRFNTGG